MTLPPYKIDRQGRVTRREDGEVLGRINGGSQYGWDPWTAGGTDGQGRSTRKGAPNEMAMEQKDR